MKIGGINTLTLLDFPGKVAAIVFTAGCNFRCGYCHNVQFVLPEQIEKLSGHFIPKEKFFNFLETRKNLLDGVVISGGEPTIWPDLPDFLKEIKKRGFLTKLDTNGTNPEMIEKLLKEKLVDYIAMDIKMPLNEYETLSCVKIDGTILKQSVELIKKSTIEYEFRTTVIEEFHDVNVIENIFKDIGSVKKFTLQNFRPEKTLCPSFGEFHACTAQKLKTFKKIAEKYVDKVVVHE